MNRPSRRTLILAATLALVASLVAVGRLTQLRSGTLGGPTVSSAQPAAAPSVVKLAVSGPVDDVAHALAPVAGNRIVENVWILHGGRVSRVDPQAGRVVATVSGSRPAVRLATTPADRVVATMAGGRVLVIDPQTARVVTTEPVDTRARVASTIDLDLVAVCCGAATRPGDGRLVRFAGPRPRRTVPLSGRPDAVGVGPSGVWVRGSGGGVWRIDLDTLRVVATVDIPGGLGGTPGSVAVTTDAVWVSDPARATVWHIDPEGNRVVGSVPADGWDLTVGTDGIVWATSGNRLLALERDGVRRTLTLEQLGSDRVNAIVAVPYAVWVAAPSGLFRVDLATLP